MNQETEKALVENLKVISENLNAVHLELRTLWKLKIFEIVNRSQKKDTAKESIQNFLGDKDQWIKKVLENS